MSEYTVRVTITDNDGCTYTQLHVRTERISREAFDSLALGRMLRMISEFSDAGMAITGWKIEEIRDESILRDWFRARRTEYFNHVHGKPQGIPAYFYNAVFSQHTGRSMVSV